MLEKQNKLSAHTVLRIAEGTSHKIGDEFHTALIETLSEVMDVSLVLITHGEGYPARTARTLFCWREGLPAENFQYELAGTPCALVYGRDRITVPCDLGKRFPKEKGFEGYCGVPLLNRHGTVVGHFAVFSKTPFENAELCETIMRIFGSRVEVELQRAAADRDRDALVHSLQRTRDRLEQQRDASRAANSFKSDLVAMTVHDLRNPLTAILNRAELISAYLNENTSLPPQARIEKAAQSANEIINTSERMEKMISGVLDSARANATDISYAPAKFDLSNTLATVLALNEKRALEKSLHVDCTFPETLIIHADEDRLIEAVDNLISNAIKFSQPDSGIFLSASVKETNVIISVRDEGQGIAEEELDLIFDRFENAPSNPTEDEASFGLGLWIVKTIAERHGGSVEVHSDGLGQGSCFAITLPNAL
jgi:signal transduction histidine kinase